MAFGPEQLRIPPEVYLSPEHWDGHSLDDDCAWQTPQRLPSRSFLKGMQEFRKELQAEDAAGGILRDYLALPDQILIRTFSQGDVFDATQYPEGTIVRFRREILWGVEKPLYVDSVYWGVVLRVGDADQASLIVQSQGLMRNEKTPSTHWLVQKPTLKTQEVTHERKAPSAQYSGGQDIERINAVQLMRQGIGVLKVVPQERRGVLGNLRTSEN